MSEQDETRDGAQDSTKQAGTTDRTSPVRPALRERAAAMRRVTEARRTRTRNWRRSSRRRFSGHSGAGAVTATTAAMPPTMKPPRPERTSSSPRTGWRRYGSGSSRSGRSWKPTRSRVTQSRSRSSTGSR